MVNKRTSIKPTTIKMSNAAQYKPKTRQELADTLGICTKTLARFLKKEDIPVVPRATLKSKLVEYIIHKYHED